jgi:hypothetical protein
MQWTSVKHRSASVSPRNDWGITICMGDATSNQATKRDRMADGVNS